MKRSIVITLAVLTIGLLLAGVVHARWNGYGMGHEMGYGMGYGSDTDIETLKKFRKETLSLREDLMDKEIEIQNEYNKKKPNTKRVAELRKEIIDLQSKIEEIADKHEIAMPVGRGMKSQGMMGRGMMGAGCPCPMCQ